MEKKIRCFVSIGFPKGIISKIKGVQEVLQKRDFFIGKFTEPENIHLTLKFLGEIDEHKIEEVKIKLKGIKFRKFLAQLGDIGVFNEKFIRIIWIQIFGKEVEELQKEIDISLKYLFDPENRFMSHLTIARVKKVLDKKKLLDELKNIKIPDLKFEIDKFYLMKSDLTSDRPVYSVIEEFNLS